jgi:hypothetical protein
MANTIKQKRGTTDPVAGDLVVGELAINTTDGGVFTKTDGGSVVEVGAGGVTDIDGLSDAVTYNSGQSIGLGANALDSEDGGLYRKNTAVGYDALTAVTTGQYNVALGYQAGKTFSSSNYNTAIGTWALQNYAGTGNGYNTAVGYFSGNNNTTCQYNTYLGAGAGFSTTSGSQNVFLGYQAGDNVTTGSNNTVIGNGADASSATVSNEITLGNTSITTLRCNTQTISSLSDGRDKTEVEDLPLGLDFINTLRPVKFKWETRDGNGKDGAYDAGFIAQDLQSAQSASDAEYLNMVMDENPDRLEACYGQLIPVLVQAIKDLKVEIDTLKANA